jgi:putative Mn2+ efflux pump MntP
MPTLTGFAASIDAMAVGAGLVHVNASVNIDTTTAAVGLDTATMGMIGEPLGLVVGCSFSESLRPANQS